MLIFRRMKFNTNLKKKRFISPTNPCDRWNTLFTKNSTGDFKVERFSNVYNWCQSNWNIMHVYNARAKQRQMSSLNIWNLLQLADVNHFFNMYKSNELTWIIQTLILKVIQVHVHLRLKWGQVRFVVSIVIFPFR